MRAVDDLSEESDSGEWERLGRQLRRVDPRRYLEIREIAERIVLIHEDPANPRLQLRSHPVVSSQRPREVA